MIVAISKELWQFLERELDELFDRQLDAYHDYLAGERD